VTRFLGNAIGEKNATLAASLGLQAQASEVKPRPVGFLARLYRNRTVHYLAQGLYNRLYTVINAYE
jgi:hypothetical protein